MTPGAETAIRDALVLARLGRGGRAWVVVATPVELPLAPSSHFAAARGRHRMLLHDADGWLLGEGQAWEHTADGPGRFVALAEAAATLTARCLVAGDPQQLPRLLLSAAFADRVTGPAWAGIPAARLVLPARLWWREANGRGWRIDAAAVTTAQTAADILAQLERGPETQPDTPAEPWDNVTTGFTGLVEDAAALVREGAFRKVVLARAVDRAAPAIETVVARLIPDCGTMVYAIDLPDGACFAGATPELLLDACGTHIHTMALAGSRSRGSDDDATAAELFACTKERKEHQLVVEHLATVLAPRCAPLSLPASPGIRRLPRLLHLETRIDAELLHADHLELVGTLHPTPAVCGLPVAAARSYLARREGLHRGLYAGTAGWLTPNAARIHVLLRGALLRGGRARCFAGAGIVETSDPDRELSEANAKLAVIDAVLQ